MAGFAGHSPSGVPRLLAPAPGPTAFAGSLNVIQANQTLSATATVLVVGTLAVTQAANTIAAAASVLVVGTLSRTQAANTLTGGASVVIGATLSRTQAAQTITAHATVAPPIRDNDCLLEFETDTGNLIFEDDTGFLALEICVAGGAEVGEGLPFFATMGQLRCW